MPDDEAVRVRVRGIYATALTALFADDYTVVQASSAIRDRFDESFPVGPQDCTVATTDDRQGVGLSGTPPAVAAVRDRLAGVARDAFTWPDPAPRAAVFQGVVVETHGSGAVVELDATGTEGFLPYDRTEDYVEEGDTRRLQVTAPAPPWRDARPTLSPDLVVPGGLLELERGETAASRGETVRLAELLEVDPPAGWTPRVASSADDADLAALESALERAGERAEAVMAAIADADPDDAPGPLAMPLSGAWVWFGRESRFALDGARREVTVTMPGHHRIKAAAEAASAAVDFVEAVCPSQIPTGDSTDSGDVGKAAAAATDEGSAFPVGVVLRQFGPTTGDRVAIQHGKPDGRVIVLGRGEVTDWTTDGAITVERELTGGGTYDALGTERHAGDVATTTFVEGRWWYATVYRGTDGTLRGTYVNVCTPLELFPDAVRYIDLHVDVVKTPDGTVRRVDDDELDAAVADGQITESLANRARQVAASVERALASTDE